MEKEAARRRQEISEETAKEERRLKQVMEELAQAKRKAEEEARQPFDNPEISEREHRGSSKNLKESIVKSSKVKISKQKHGLIPTKSQRKKLILIVMR